MTCALGSIACATGSLWLRGAVLAAALQAVVACGGSDRVSAVTAASPAKPGPAPITRLVSGRVYDTLSASIAGARVEALDASQAGGVTTTNADGTFTLTAAFTARLRVTKDGYEPAETPVSEASWVYLAASDTVNLTGPYTLTVEADSACLNLPFAARKRTYTATVTRNATRSGLPFFTAMLDGPGLDNYFRNIMLQAGGDTVVFDLSDNGIVEEIADEAYFSIGGVGSARGATESGVSAPFSGTIDYCEVKPGTESSWPCAGPVVTREQCQSSNHRLTLARR